MQERLADFSLGPRTGPLANIRPAQKLQIPVRREDQALQKEGENQDFHKPLDVLGREGCAEFLVGKSGGGEAHFKHNRFSSFITINH